MESNIKILVVDDRQENLLALKAILESSFYQIVTANSGEEALKKLLQDNFAVILLDVQMPGINGYETAKLIRLREKSKHIPIIFITANYQAIEQVRKGYSLGAIDYIFKPIDPETLKYKIEGFVNLFRYQEQLEILIAERTCELSIKNYELLKEIELRKKTEIALRCSQEKFLKAFNNNQTAMSFTSLKDNTIVDVNRKHIELTGYAREEYIGKHISDIWVDLTERQNMLNEIYKFGYVENFQARLRKKSGDIAITNITANILNIEGDMYILASTIDITEYIKAEEKLRLSQELFYKVFEINPHAIAIISIKNRIIKEVNQAFAAGTGYSKQELIGLSIDDINLWEDINEHNRFIEEIREKGLVINREVKVRMDSGNIGVLLLSGAIINWENEECTLEIANDITKLKSYENEMARLDRLNLIGEISASIAHEIRNPLTTVKGFLQLFKSEDRPHKENEHIELMIEELDRSNAIISEFLSLARNKPIQLKLENLNQKIDTILPLLQADSMKNDINIRLELGEIPKVMLDEAEIRQLLLNLVRNGLEAMLPGGYLTIKTFFDNDNNEVTLSIKDQGHGISPEVLKKIGTPFYTTKDHGAGLGLAACYSIAQRHNARIEVETGPAGTTFRVIFPV
ncbi:MAG: PAS domain S-box protein [Syntrophomonadaceae bacterium]|jgi:two-component system, sporulation sensor kinase E